MLLLQITCSHLKSHYYSVTIEFMHKFHLHFTSEKYLCTLFTCYIQQLFDIIVKTFFLQFRIEYLCFICTPLSLCQSYIPHNVQPTTWHYAGMANKSVRTKLTQLVPASRRIMNRYERLSERVSLYDNIATVHKVRRMPLFQLSLPNARVVAARYVLLAILIYDVCFAMLFRCDTIYIYVINDMRACTFKHIMLHFHSGNDKLKEHFAAPRKKILPSSTASDCYGYCETYVFTYFHMQHVVTCLDSLRVRGYTFSRMGCRKQ